RSCWGRSSTTSARREGEATFRSARRSPGSCSSGSACRLRPGISPSSWSRSTSCCRTRPRAGTSGTTTSSSTSPRASESPSAWRPCTCSRSPTPRRPGRSPGRRGGRRWCASWSRRSSACSSAARWGSRRPSASPSGPRSYFLTLPVERIAAHFALLRTPVGAAEVRTQSGPGSRAGAHELTVVAADRPGLLSWIAGALSLAGLSILTAQVFTTEDGTALDVFEVEGLFEPEIDEERWRRFRAALRKAIEGRISLEHQVLDKRRHYRSPRAEVPVRVSVHNDVSDFFTVVEVGAPDRIGLLF